MKAVHLTAYGDPNDGLQFVELPDPGAPGPGQVSINVEFAPIIPSDFLLARGLYNEHPDLPSVIGNEGVGVVREVGGGVANVKAGDRVLVPHGTYSWAEVVHAPAKDLFIVDPAIDPQQASMLSINPPTAGLLLDNYADLKAGDWVVINSGNSGVGRALIAYAKDRGLHTISLVRRPEVIDELKAIGGDVVVVDSDSAAAEIKQLTSNAPVRLGLDGQSGKGTGRLAEIVTEFGVTVTYGTMTNEPVTVNPFDLVNKRLSLQGFYMYYPDNVPKLADAIATGARLLKEGKFHVPVAATYAPHDIKKAVAHALKGGKVLLDFTA